MFENIDIDKLKRAKEKLEDLKALKFSISASKHKGDKYALPELLRHYRSENNELEHALFIGDPRQIETELADVSNMIDLIFEYLDRFIEEIEKGGEQSRPKKQR